MLLDRFPQCEIPPQVPPRHCGLDTFASLRLKQSFSSPRFGTPTPPDRRYNFARAQQVLIIKQQAIGAAKDAARMDRVVNFYAKLPRGSAPEVKPTGLIGRYQARYFGKNPSAARKCRSALIRGRCGFTND